VRPLHNPIVQALAAWLVAAWLRFCFATIRWQHENEHLAEEVWAQGGGVLVAFWHCRGPMSAASWPRDRATPTKGLVSLSRDGQFMARAVGHLGFPAIRGSSAKKGDGAGERGGAVALREILRQLKVGGVALSPDGPRGPANQMGQGLPVMAKLSGAPVLMLGISCYPAFRLKTWDRNIIPRPFGRGAIVWDRVDYPKGADPEQIALDWTARLNAVEARADAITGLT
jgi:hypothetical protein